MSNAEHLYFAQFAGENTYLVQRWQDPRVEAILDEVGIIERSYQWTGTNCDFITHSHSSEDIEARLLKVKEKYQLTNIHTFKPEWASNDEAHGHFSVQLSPLVLWDTSDD